MKQLRMVLAIVDVAMSLTAPPDADAAPQVVVRNITHPLIENGWFSQWCLDSNSAGDVDVLHCTLDNQFQEWEMWFAHSYRRCAQLGRHRALWIGEHLPCFRPLREYLDPRTLRLRQRYRRRHIHGRRDRRARSQLQIRLR